jgi:hypothetical protein
MSGGFEIPVAWQREPVLAGAADIHVCRGGRLHPSRTDNSLGDSTHYTHPPPLKFRYLDPLEYAAFKTSLPGVKSLLA